MESDSDSEYETVQEETYVVLDIDPKTCEEEIKPRDPYSMIGLETPTPFFQIGRNTFRGEYDDANGTDMIFEIKNGKPEFIATTYKRIRTIAIELEKKAEDKELLCK